MNWLEKWEAEIARVDKKVEPIAKSPIDFERLREAISPWEDPNTRDVLNSAMESAQPTLKELIDKYCSCDESLRREIRNLFSKYSSFRWAVNYKRQDNSSVEVKRHLAYLSIVDQGDDTRDFLMSISGTIKRFKEEGIPYKTELAEVVSISSLEDKYGWGTTAELLERLL